MTIHIVRDLSLLIYHTKNLNQITYALLCSHCNDCNCSLTIILAHD